MLDAERQLDVSAFSSQKNMSYVLLPLAFVSEKGLIVFCWLRSLRDLRLVVSNLTSLLGSRSAVRGISSIPASSIQVRVFLSQKNRFAEEKMELIISFVACSPARRLWAEFHSLRH